LLYRRASCVQYVDYLFDQDSFSHEHHPDTLLNLGKAEGSVDAGNMIKPALARGLQLVGATTREW